MLSCEEAWNSVKDWFVETNKPIISWKWRTQYISDYKLSRYACYLIAQNWEKNKKWFKKN